MNKVFQIAEDVQSKVETLINRQQLLVEKCRDLEHQLRQLEVALMEEKTKSANLEHENKQLRVAKALEGGGSDVSEAKATINELMREIDKCIAMLNA